MDPTTSPTTPLGPMTRAHARALETEVTSLLSQLPFDSHETWLLPQEETICVTRYLEEGYGTTTLNGKGGEDTKYKEQEEELPGNLQPTDVRRLSHQPADQVPGWPDNLDSARTIRTPVRTI